MSGTDLIVIEPTMTAAVVFRDGGARSVLDAIKAEVAKAEPDISTPRGREDLKSLVYKIRRSKTALDGMGKSLTDEWRERAERVHEERRMIREELDALIEQVRLPLTEWERKEDLRITAHEEAIRWYKVVEDAAAGASLAELRAIIDRIHAEPARDWQEFEARAQRVRAATLASLNYHLARATEREAAEAAAEEQRQREAEDRRLEAERLQAEREARIAAEAAEKARQAAEREAQEKADAEARRVEQERLAAAQRERDARAATERAEREKIAAEERSRQLEAARVDRHRLEIARIPEGEGYGMIESAAELQMRLKHLRSIRASDFEEFADEAASVIHGEIERTETLLETAQQREADAAERDRVEREMRAEELREVDRIEAEKREAAAADRAREEERRRAEAEQTRERDAAAARERNASHRRRINREILDAILLAISDVHTGDKAEATKIGTAIGEAIARDLVPHVSIKY